MMKILYTIFWILLLSKFIYCEFNYSALSGSPNDSLGMWFNQLNYQYKLLSHYSTLYKWEIFVNCEKNFENDFNYLLVNLSNWKRKQCFEGKNYLDQMTQSQQRMIFMLCRGPNYNKAELKEVINILENIKNNWKSSKIVQNQETDLIKVIGLMNIAAIRNGYHDIGECWRKDLETDHLEEKVDRFWTKINPFYKLLHGVLRNSLQEKYRGQKIVTKTGSLPANFFRSLSNWETSLDFLMPFRNVKLDENFSKKNWTNLDMAKRAEDFYSSLGLSRMTHSFWKSLNFAETRNESNCCNSFVNMFDDKDFRISLCRDQSLNGFYNIVHLMGNIEYNMHFRDQSALFQNPTNSAFGNVFGDVIYLGMITPQHFNRLGLLPDKFLYPNKVPIQNSNLRYDFDGTDIFSENTPKFDNLNSDFSLHIIQKDNHKSFEHKIEEPLNDFDLSLLLRMALIKIPKISFEYVMDKVRWNLLSDKINFTTVNPYFWKLINEEQGIYHLNSVNHPYIIDMTAEFHITNNIPYVPYLLSSLLEVQIFKGLCEYTIFGEFNSGKQIPMPLHRCDIYGSKRAGKLLKKAMSLGSSVHWSEVLYILTGKTEISSIPLLEYYEPLIIWLESIVIRNDIPLGW